MKAEQSTQLELLPILCECEDDNGTVCGRAMSREELEQDGMCSICADHVWCSITNGDTFIHDYTEER